MSNTTLLLEALPLRQRLLYSLIDLHRRESEELPQQKHERLLNFYVSCCKELLESPLSLCVQEDSNKFIKSDDNMQGDYHKVLLEDDSTTDEENLANIYQENNDYTDDEYNTRSVHSDDLQETFIKSDNKESDQEYKMYNDICDDFIDFDITKLAALYKE